MVINGDTYTVGSMILYLGTGSEILTRIDRIDSEDVHFHYPELGPQSFNLSRGGFCFGFQTGVFTRIVDKVVITPNKKIQQHKMI
jgi:hypothetical protein